MIRVLIADDQELIRQSLSFVLDAQADIEMVGTASNGREAIELVRKEKPDVVLMDIRMPEVDGVECTRLIKAAYPQIKVIILTTFDDDEYVSARCATVRPAICSRAFRSVSWQTRCARWCAAARSSCPAWLPRRWICLRAWRAAVCRSR